MNIMSKLLTAIKGGVNEIGEAVVDSQSLRIFEQEIRDSKENLVKAKQGLTEIVAKKLAAERNLGELKSEISENEGYAGKALEKNEETLALEIANRIAKLDSKAETLTSDVASYSENVETLKSQINEAEKLIAEHERELTMVKTRESVQRATKSVTRTITTNESAIGTARDSLERIKKKQQHEQDKIDAGIQLRKESENDDLDKKLKASGIKQEKHTAEAVLARLKK